MSYNEVIMSDISSRIDMLLSSRHKKRIDLVKATGLNESTIRGWNRGCSPSSDALYKVAQYFGVTMEWLTTGEDYSHDSDFVLTEDERTLIELYRHLDKRDKNAVATLNRALESQYHADDSQMVALADKDIDIG